MVITPHAVAGAVVARPLSSAPIAVMAGMATHVVLDRIPHQDYPLNAIAFLTVDTAVAALLTHRLSSANRTVMLAGAIGGVLPDVAQVIERVLGVNITRTAHRANHTTVVWPLWAGVSSQLGTVAVCVGALALSNRRRGRRDQAHDRFGDLPDDAELSRPAASRAAFAPTRPGVLDVRPPHRRQDAQHFTLDLQQLTGKGRERAAG